MIFCLNGDGNGGFDLVGFERWRWWGFWVWHLHSGLFLLCSGCIVEKGLQCSIG